MKRNGGVIGGFLSERVADNAMLTQRCMVSFGHAIAPRLLPAVYDSFAPPNVNASVPLWNVINPILKQETRIITGLVK